MSPEIPDQGRMLVFVYDTHVRIEATSKEDADKRLMDVEIEVDAMGGTELVVFDAWGCEDLETGDEIREVH